MAMIPDKPWRLEDMKFHDEGGKRRGELGPVVVVESGGKYSVTMASHDLRLSWSDLEEEQVDPALDAAFVALNARSG
jgi:hypothetical protein